jgi:hypothetical protein
LSNFLFALIHSGTEFLHLNNKMHIINMINNTQNSKRMSSLMIWLKILPEIVSFNKAIFFRGSNFPILIIIIILVAEKTRRAIKGTWQQGGFSGVFAEIGTA